MPNSIKYQSGHNSLNLETSISTDKITHKTVKNRLPCFADLSVLRSCQSCRATIPIHPTETAAAIYCGRKTSPGSARQIRYPTPLPVSQMSNQMRYLEKGTFFSEKWLSIITDSTTPVKLIQVAQTCHGWLPLVQSISMIHAKQIVYTITFLDFFSILTFYLSRIK